MIRQNNSLAHTTWNCKYHIVFASKYRRQIIYGKYKASIGQIFRLLCERKGIEIHEAEACPDQIFDNPQRPRLKEFLDKILNA